MKNIINSFRRTTFVIIPVKKNANDIKKGKMPIFDYFKVTCQDKDAEITEFFEEIARKVSDRIKTKLNKIVNLRKN